MKYHLYETNKAIYGTIENRGKVLHGLKVKRKKRVNLKELQQLEENYNNKKVSYSTLQYFQIQNCETKEKIIKNIKTKLLQQAKQIDRI